MRYPYKPQPTGPRLQEEKHPAFVYVKAHNGYLDYHQAKPHIAFIAQFKRHLIQTGRNISVNGFELDGEQRVIRIQRGEEFILLPKGAVGPEISGQ